MAKTERTFFPGPSFHIHTLRVRYAEDRPGGDGASCRLSAVV